MVNVHPKVVFWVFLASWILKTVTRWWIACSAQETGVFIVRLALLFILLWPCKCVLYARVSVLLELLFYLKSSKVTAMSCVSVCVCVYVCVCVWCWADMWKHWSYLRPVEFSSLSPNSSIHARILSTRN